MQSPEEKGHVRAERDKLNEDIDLIYRTLLVKEDESAGALSAGTARPGDGSARGEESGNAKQDLPGLEEGEIFLDDNDDRSSDREDSSSAVQTNIGDVSTQEGITDESKVQEAANLLMSIECNDSSASPETCLVLNRAYQEALIETISSIEVILAHNRERQKALETEIESGLSQPTALATREKILINFGVPYFKDAKGTHPPANYDVESKNSEYDPYEKVTRMWTDTDSHTLMKAVAADSLKKVMQPLMNRKSLEIEKLEACNSEDEKESIRCRLDDLETDITRARFTKEETLYGNLHDIEAIDKIDWMKISAFDFDGLYSETYLKAKWQNHVHPSINKSKWSPNEDEHLAQLAQCRRFRNWDAIAFSLRTNRSAIQCLQRYQTKLAPSLAMGPWTGEEDEALKKVVETFTFGNDTAWHQVSCYLEGRTREQCIARWEALNKNYKRGRWTTEEDVRLLAAVHCYGQSWPKVQQFVPSRTLPQIRERWTNSLAQELKYGKWTYEEDRHLILSVERHGERWAAIAREMEGRTDNMLLQRYRRLMAWKKENQELNTLPREELENYQHRESVVRKKQDGAASLKVRRLLEQKKAQEEFLEKERKSDLVLKVEGDSSDNSGDEYSKVPSTSNPEGANKDQSEPQTTTSSAPKRDGAMHLVAKRTYAEREKNWEREKALIEEDLKKGIYVPRPPDTNATRVVNYIEKRKTLHEAIMNHVRETLKTTSKGDPQVVFERLRCNLASKDIKLDMDQDELDMVLSDPSPTVQTLLSQVESIKKGKQRHNIRRKSDILSHDKSRSVELGIMKILREKNTMRRKVGRPRKFLDDGGRDGMSIPTGSRSHEVEMKICNLMLTTMNMDKVGSAVMASAITNFGKTKGQSAATASSSGQEAVDEQGQTNSEPCTFDDIEDSGPVVTEDELQGIKKRWRKKHQNEDFGAVHGFDEYNNKLVVRSPADKQSKDDVKYLNSVTELDDPKVCPRVYRRVLIGQAEKIYHIPPLPPNSTTLRAFKTLLLNRRLLVTNAQNYHVPSTLDGKRSKVTDETDTQEEPTLHKAVETVDKQIPTNVIKSLDSELHLSDLTPHILKKLKKQFTPEEIRSAQVLLKRKEALQKSLHSKGKIKTVVSPIFDKSVHQDSRTKFRRNMLRKAKLSHDYQLLKSRFMSLFLWPAMMSSFELRDSDSTKKERSSPSREQNQCSTSQGTEASPSKKKKRLPMTGTKRARKEQVKKRATKVAFQKTMSDIKKSTPRKPRQKKIKSEGTVTPLRQSRRLKDKMADQEPNPDDLVEANDTNNETHATNGEERESLETWTENQADVESSHQDPHAPEGDEDEDQISVEECDTAPDDIAGPPPKRQKSDDQI